MTCIIWLHKEDLMVLGLIVLSMTNSRTGRGTGDLDERYLYYLGAAIGGLRNILQSALSSLTSILHYLGQGGD